MRTQLLWCYDLRRPVRVVGGWVALRHGAGVGRGGPEMAPGCGSGWGVPLYRARPVAASVRVLAWWQGMQSVCPLPSVSVPPAAWLRMWSASTSALPGVPWYPHLTHR